MKKKLKILVLVVSTLLVIFISLKLIPYQNGQSYWGHIHDDILFHPPEQAFKLINDIPSIEIEVDTIELQKLIALHSTIDYKKEGGLNYYRANNKWVKCKIKHQNKSYKAKIKCHSNSPYRQKEGDRISLKVKLKKGKILGQKKFKLIIYERIRENHDQLNWMAKHFGLHYVQHRWFNVKVNNSKSIPYFFRGQLKNSVKEIPNLINVKRKWRKSLLAIHPFDSVPFAQINGAKKISLQQKNIYKNTNRAIKTGDLDTLKKYFPLEYMAKLHVCALIIGAKGHGFSPGNFVAPLDTSSLKFYPFLHRDFFKTKYPTEQPQEILRVHHREFFGEKIADTILLTEHLVKIKEYQHYFKQHLNKTLSESSTIKNAMDSIAVEMNQKLTIRKGFNPPDISFLGIKDPYKDLQPITVNDYIKQNLDYLNKLDQDSLLQVIFTSN